MYDHHGHSFNVTLDGNPWDLGYAPKHWFVLKSGNLWLAPDCDSGTIQYSKKPQLFKIDVISGALMVNPYEGGWKPANLYYWTGSSEPFYVSKIEKDFRPGL